MSIWLLINKVLLDYRWECVNSMNIPEKGVTRPSAIFTDGFFTFQMNIRDTIESSEHFGTAHWGAIFGVPFKDRLELRNKTEIP